MQEIIRCACYTRKSVEDATLDRDFNSLTSQREACENYINSQKSKGWVCLPEHYDDGGFSGGNMNRPAMTRLKADIEAGKIDMVICYKIDRLSRSIIDFAELQKFFEEHNVHFVSVTQDINTSNSSGRMLLNILITFAAFERDLIIDRVRSAIEGGKKRGKFCGGVPMLGYRSDPFTKKLLIDEEEAKTVRLIFEKYMALESIQATVSEINRLGLKTREWVSVSTGKKHTAKPWNSTSIHRILTSPIYAGYVSHYDTNYEGEHEAIIPRPQWEKVQDEVVARYNEIEMPRISADEFTPPEKPQKESKGQKKSSDRIDEIQWLDEIYKKCDEYGIHFSKRILKAFHTAVKTAEWSPITILAGVSGTGKSELPRLYSHFGGLLFEPLSVQPNWDSQESMLGFFNSIDNKFDAQPVLRFLAQTQQPSNLSGEERLARWEKMAGSAFKFDPDNNETHKKLLEQLQGSVYPGADDCMGMVLLDEMNLAHPELYFAEFLSKLELRRGKGRGDLPFLPVKIGAGLPPYELPLGRNILWVGTMNQDETTKSLSDKVLDRSIIIYFPRPTQLVRRKKLMPLKDANRKLIYKGDFQQWWAMESEFTQELIAPYKQFIERMNDSLGIAGRAIGHRVWQSVEYYMANYPDVRVALRNGGDSAAINAAMHVAFEDQLVQKVMPKLRGIDTRGTFAACLKEIRTQLNAGIDDKPFDLDKDFELACVLGHGQFMWQSANYLNEDVEVNASAEKDNAPEGSSDDSTSDPDENRSSRNDEGQTPPDWYRPDDKSRIARWNRMSPEKQQEMIENYKRQPKQ